MYTHTHTHTHTERETDRDRDRDTERERGGEGGREREVSCLAQNPKQLQDVMQNWSPGFLGAGLKMEKDPQWGRQWPEPHASWSKANPVGAAS